MHRYYSVLKKNLLFLNFEDADLRIALKSLNARLKHYSKNEIIRFSDTEITEIGIIADGSVLLTKTDYKGNRMILSELHTGNSFGEALSFTGVMNSPISVVAAKDSSIILISADNIINNKELECSFHKRIMTNLVKLLAEKNMLLQMKNDILSQKTTREKLLLYFEYESKTAGSKSFKINFSREELADFLSVNSSALSRELGEMRDEGILIFKKNRFVLKYTKND